LRRREYGSRVRCSEHQTLLRFGGTAAVVRLRSDIGDGADLEPGGLQRAESRLAAGSPGPDEDVDLRRPVLLALRAALSRPIWRRTAWTCREPLKPTWPADAQLITLPCGSQIETIVLLNVLLMCAWPWEMFFFSLRRTSSRRPF